VYVVTNCFAYLIFLFFTLFPFGCVCVKCENPRWPCECGRLARLKNGREARWDVAFPKCICGRKKKQPVSKARIGKRIDCIGRPPFCLCFLLWLRMEIISIFCVCLFFTCVCFLLHLRHHDQRYFLISLPEERKLWLFLWAMAAGSWTDGPDFCRFLFFLAVQRRGEVKRVCACGWALEEPCLYNSRACIFFSSGFFFVTLAHNPKFFDLFFPGSLNAWQSVTGQRALEWGGGWKGRKD